MSKRDDPADQPPDGLIDSVKRIALQLGFHWDGLGGAFRERLDDGRTVWRVYNEWGGVGAYADVDAVTGELLRLEGDEPEREGAAVPIPDHLVPQEDELIAFARAKLAPMGWALPDPLVVVTDESKLEWRVSTRGADGPACIELGGRRGNLHVKRISRV